MPTPATYVIPQTYNLESNIDYTDYDRTVIGTMTLQQLVHNLQIAAEPWGVTFNAVILSAYQFQFGGIWRAAYNYIYPVTINSDPIFTCDPEYTGAINNRSGVVIPENTGYFYCFNTDGTMYRRMVGSFNQDTINGKTYKSGNGYGSQSWVQLPSIVILLNTASQVYLNDVDISPVNYDWEPFAQLSGNSGSFLLDLSQIKKSAIGDAVPEVVTSDASLFTISQPSVLRRLGANLQEGVETPILYCGDNFATATRRTGEGISSIIVYITLKFYYRSGILAFTAPEHVAYYEAGDAVSPEVYLSIIYDDEHQVATVDYIQYAPNTDNYKYNLSELQNETQLNQLWVWLQDNGETHPEGNPYDTGSTDNGGTPGTPRPQDPIHDTPLPTISGLNMGIVTLYHPDDTEVAAISQFLWSDNVLDNFKKYFNNFADNILSLYILPYTPASLPTKTFKVGNMTSEIAGVEYVTARYYDIDMGSVEVLPRWGSYLDYAPYTKIEIYLPYLGSHSLDVDEIMSPTKQDGTLPTGQGSKLKLKYRLDILTGVIVAKIFINNELRYQFEGKCGASIPLTGQTFASMVQGIVQAGAGLATTIATGGLTAPLSAAAAVAGTVNATKPSVERVGNISGDASMMSSDIPYITISSPSKPLLDTQEKYTGFPSYKAATLGNFSGFTQVIEAHVEGISCTEEERTLILKWLKEGIII